MKTVIYARKSTIKDGQKDTIENQIKICKRRANELGLTIVDIKKDTASGTTDNNRDEIKELIKEAKQGKFECVIIKGISRLYRDVEHGLGLIKRLDRSGIRVITVEENFDSLHNRSASGHLDTNMITMYLMFAENESKKLAERIKHTQIEKAHAGEWNQAASPPIGYVYNKNTKKLDIDFKNAETVKLIFELYISGMGMKTIAFYLNGDNDKNLKYPTPKDKLWSQYTIGFILKNQVYCGDVVYNRRSKKMRPYKEPERLGKTDEDIYVGNDHNKVEEWIITKDAHPAIVSRETFEKVKSIMSQKAIRTGIKHNLSLMAGIAKCGKCGSGMTFKRGNKDKHGRIKTVSNYYCSRYIKYGRKFCDSHHVRANDFDDLIIETLQTRVDERINFKDVTSSLRPQSSSLEQMKERIRKIEMEIESISRKTDAILEKNLEGSISDVQFARMNEKYVSEIETLNDTMVKLKTEMLTMEEDKTDEERLKSVYDEVVNLKSYGVDRQRFILMDLIDIVKVTDGEIEIEYNF